MREKNIPYDVTYLADAFSSFFALLAELWSPAAVAARTKNAATARDRPDAVDIAKTGQKTNLRQKKKKKPAALLRVFFWCYGGKHKLPVFRKQPRQRLPLQGKRKEEEEEERGFFPFGVGAEEEKEEEEEELMRRRGKRAFLLSSLLRTSFPDSFAIGLPSLLLLFRRERTRRVRP